MHDRFTRTIAFFSLVVIYYGFRFVTQAGQGLDAIQNDGYAGVGGVMILAGGVMIGMLMTRKNK